MIKIGEYSSKIIISTWQEHLYQKVKKYETKMQAELNNSFQNITVWVGKRS